MSRTGLASGQGSPSSSAARKSGRGAGYCINTVCEHHGRGRMLKVQIDSFVCSRCGRPGKVELERGVRSGDFDVFSEVRVEWGFDPLRDIYTQRTVVTEERLLRPHAIYTLQTPLVESVEGACAVGRMILDRLNARTFSKSEPQARPTRDQMRAQGWSTLV